MEVLVCLAAFSKKKFNIEVPRLVPLLNLIDINGSVRQITAQPYFKMNENVRLS